MLVAKADKKLSSWGMFGNKYDDAAELLEKAASQFKLGKACESTCARDAYVRWKLGACCHRTEFELPYALQGLMQDRLMKG